MLIQIGTIGYKQGNGEYNTYPLLMEETEELKDASIRLFDNAYEIITRDLANFEQKTKFLTNTKEC